MLESEGKQNNQMELSLSIYRSLFNWTSVRAGFEEREWESFWHEEL